MSTLLLYRALTPPPYQAELLLKVVFPLMVTVLLSTLTPPPSLAELPMKVVFLHEVEYNLMQTSKIIAAFDSAPAALQYLVHLGYKLSQRDPSDLATVMHTIQEAIPTLDSRIVMEYTLTVASARWYMCAYTTLATFLTNIFNWHFGIICV